VNNHIATRYALRAGDGDLGQAQIVAAGQLLQQSRTGPQVSLRRRTTGELGAVDRPGPVTTAGARPASWSAASSCSEQLR
jgi:hypothetical protein